MKTLTVDDNVAPFAVLPSNGSSEVTVTPRTASAGSGATLNAVQEDTTLAPVALDATATVVIATVNITSVGNAFKLTYSGIVDLVQGTGAFPDATFSVTIDGSSVPEMNGEVAFEAVGADPTALNATFSRTVWIFGQTPGAHTIVLKGDLSGPTTSTATVPDPLQLSVEDWTF